MWIIPNTCQFSHFAPECLELNGELNELPQELEQSLMWRSKLSSTSIWLRRWNRDWWIKHLFGRILKPSTEGHFVTKYTESLPDIRVKEKAQSDSGNSKKIQDTFGRIFDGLSRRLTLFGASSKMSEITSQELSNTFLETFEILVTQLSREYIRRLKSELHTSGKDYSSLHVPTLTDCGGVWPTPTVESGAYQKSPGGTVRLQLPKAVTFWATPTVLESQKATKGQNQKSSTKMAVTGQLHLGHHSINGKNQGQYPKESGGGNRRLNPAWVAQLMDTTLQSSFFACMATELSDPQPKKRSEIS